MVKVNKITGGVDISLSKEVCKEDTDTGMVAKDAQECENNKLYIICDNMSAKTTFFDKYICKYEKKSQNEVHFRLWGGL